MVVAIIVAGGYGKRMGMDRAKQYLLLGGVPILVHTVRTFDCAQSIDRVIVVVPENDVEYVKETIVAGYELKKVSHIVAGGRERQDSVQSGLAHVGDDAKIVVIHDGVRPLITGSLIDAIVFHARKNSAVTLGVPVKDTVKSVDDGGVVQETLERGSLWLVQTPQAFKKDILERAHMKARNENHYGTDDASLVERLNIAVTMITGSYENIKITTQDDLEMGEFLLQKRGRGVA